MADYENSEKVLENQLHQQFAENDNKRIGTFTSFIAVIITLFGTYSYVFVNTRIDTNLETNICKNLNFGIQELFLISFVTIGILLFLSILVLNFGFSFRRDHFIINNIRIKRYEESKTKMEVIFGSIYSPFGKGYFDFLPGFYNLFFWLFFISEIFLYIITIKKVICIIISNCNCKDIIYFILFLVFSILFLFFTLKARCCYYKKYKDMAKQFQTPQKSDNFKDCSLPK